MTFPIISALTAGALLILQQLLMLSVGMHRTKVSQGVGHGDDVTLERLVRRHGNLAENAAIFVAALTLLELATGQTLLVQGLAAVFVLARVAHVIAFLSPAGSHLAAGSKLFFRLRAAGAMLTALTGVVTGAALLAQALPA